MATAAILLYGGSQVVDGAVTIGVLASFVFYLQIFFDPIQQLSQLYTTYQAGMAALDKIFDLLDEEPEICRRPRRDRVAAGEGRDRASSDVDFGYGSTRGARAAGRVAASCPRARRWRWWAPPAPGKSTLAKLVARFYDPTRGRVSIDGHDLRDVTEHSLRSQLGVVPQEGFLFSGTSARTSASGARGAARGEHGRSEEIEAGRPGGRGPRVHRAPARGLRDRGGRARRAPVRRAAPAGGLRPRRRGRPAGADPRRGHVERGRDTPRRGSSAGCGACWPGARRS